MKREGYQEFLRQLPPEEQQAQLELLAQILVQLHEGKPLEEIEADLRRVVRQRRLDTRRDE